MTTNVTTSPLSMASQIVPGTDRGIANATGPAEEPHREADDRSSSLSEIGQRAEHDEAENAFTDGFDVNDTEAETERLEDSPQKPRKHQDVVMTHTNGLYEDRSNRSVMPALSPTVAYHDPHLEVGRMDQTSEISSLADSDEESAKKTLASPPTPRKRKRPSSEQDSTSDLDLVAEPATKAIKLVRNGSASALVDDASPGASAEEEDEAIAADIAMSPTDRTQPQSSPESVPILQRYQKGKRKGRKIRDNGTEVSKNGLISVGAPTRQDENQEAVYSNDEDCEMDETGDPAGAENAMKSEEGVLQKGSALNSLNAMEKFFATFRDKLFDERLSQCNEELAMLESPTPIHPELLAMKNVIDQRRDQKLKYEQNLMRYKLQTLQRESVANKAQAHSQYMQTAREVRDTHLEKLNKEFYQLQRERRSVDGDVPDYLYEFSTKRSQQITHQTAYNAEVSILSGLAKYVGFPAAPDIGKAKPKEIEDDLRSMGISTQPPQGLQHQPPILRAMSTTSSFSRQRIGADEHFLEQNPWANPQHPSHHQQRQLHRQVSGLSRAVTPSLTPVAQRRIVDLTEPQGSASTIAEHTPGQSSSMTATPATAETVSLGQILATSHNLLDSTPSRLTGSSVKAASANLAPLEASRDKVEGPHMTKMNGGHSPPLGRPPSRDNETIKTLPKPLPFLHTSSGSSLTSGPRTSTPGRYTVIKIEDPRHSPMPQHQQTATVSTVANGQMNRFAA